ncbi:MmgE/PrpD family protein [Egibacter rhizosphaerae]|uniref:MmgE/PrpD family protein n=1 Tax=Egibacter rhizosphaerae TaxID=1670831 RepID=A0A411YHB3_9ACTN|nr:MmgE/PrpD family protein [Egibacter rhizosphaerae]QBI20499.1 MmgE/PrpD family protein [Egibacter rhizosphaerae]
MAEDRTVEGRLGDYVATTSRPRPDVAHHATRAVVDWFAAAAVGGDRPPARALRAALADERTGSARLVPDGAPAGTRAAALVNATAAHTAEVDDIFRDGVYHPGAPTIAAALAVAQRDHADGAALLDAVTTGVEVSTRVAAAVQPAHYRFWHTTGTVGTLGAAAAVARLAGADATQAEHALAHATTLAAGLQQAFRSDAMSKPLHAGHAADAGTLAALGAREGLTGAPGLLAGPRGFGAAMSADVDWDAALADLGERANIEAITFKNHTACGHAFAPIDGALELRERVGVRADDVAEVEVATYGAAIEVAGNPHPTTPFEAQFSIPFCVASALEGGSVRLRAFEPDRLTDERIARLTDRIRLRTDADLDAAFPGRRGARVTITTTDGRQEMVERTSRRGDPESPLTDVELGDKFLELTEPVIGADAARTALATLWEVAGVADVTALPLAGGRP